MIEQVFAEMSKVPLRITGRRCPLVHLNDMYILPGELFVGKCTQHQPRCAAAADRQDEAPAGRNSRSRLCSENRRRLARHPIVIRLDFSTQPLDFSKCPPNS